MDAYYGGPTPQPNQPQQNNTKYTNSLSNKKVYSKTFLYFGLALLISGIVSIGGGYLFNVIGNPILYYTMTGISSVGILVLSIYMTFKGFSAGSNLIVPYILYSVFMGLLLSGCSYWVGSPYIFGLVLCITAALFMMMCGIGVAIGDKIGIIGTLLVGAVIGAGIMGLVSFFLFPFILTGNLASMMPYFYIGEFVFLFIMLLYVAIDMFQLKQIADSNLEVSTNICIFFALRLYSDFISILIRVLRIVALFIMNNSDN